MRERIERTFEGRPWLRLCKSVEVGERHGKRVELDVETDLALFRVDGTVYAVSNICPHKREAAIYDGYVDQGRVTCPMHGWVFDIRTGANVAKGGGLGCFTVRESDGFVWLQIDTTS
jgi:nitrite reductase/ring-hydroxylating ferredoxin subunit